MELGAISEEYIYGADCSAIYVSSGGKADAI